MDEFREMLDLETEIEASHRPNAEMLARYEELRKKFSGEAERVLTETEKRSCGFISET